MGGEWDCRARRRHVAVGVTIGAVVADAVVVTVLDTAAEVVDADAGRIVFVRGGEEDDRERRSPKDDDDPAQDPDDSAHRDNLSHPWPEDEG